MQIRSFWKTEQKAESARQGRLYVTMASVALFLALFFFIHMREVRAPILEVGMTSPRYVVTEVPFAFADEEATLIARQESLLDVGKIYYVDTEDVLKRSVEFENSLIYDQTWRSDASHSTFDEMCRANDKIEHTLKEIRFTDPRTIEKMRQLGMDTSLIHEIVPFEIHQGIYFPDDIWNFIKTCTFFDQTITASTVDYILKFYKDKVWSLKEDNQTIRKIHATIQDQIREKFTSIAAGSRIVNAGEKITPRHIAMLQAMKVALAERKSLWHPRTILGSFALTALICGILYCFLRRYQYDILKASSKFGLLVTIIIFSLATAKICEFFFIKMAHNLGDVVHYPLLTPFVGILLAVLLNDACALFIATFLAILFHTCLAFEFEGFLLANVIVGYAVIFATHTLRRRAEIVSICLKGWFAAFLLILALSLYDRARWGGAMLADIGGAGVFMMLTAILVVGLLPFFEASFKVLTDINLIEYMDPNNEVLRRLMVEAPGTYQHVLIMGGIAEAAAQAIGCNGLFCRVAALYHDIGKIPIAQYFTENQQSGENIHQHLLPQESVKIITSHVSEGVEMAKAAALPDAFIDVIKEHHGTSLVYYFYRKMLDLHKDDPSSVDQEQFRYKGPLPRSKESGIIMLADAFEAGARSLDEITQESLTALVEQIVREKIDDGQLDQCELTMEELTIIKKVMVRSLLSIGHVRIKYPARPRPLISGS